MSDAYRVTLRTLDPGPTALAWTASGDRTVVVDRPTAAGGRGLGFSGGQLLYLAIAACVSNDLYREAATLGITLHDVEIRVDGDFPARGAGSTAVVVEVDVRGDAEPERLAALLAEVDRVAEIPNSMRGTTPVEIRAGRLEPSGTGRRA